MSISGTILKNTLSNWAGMAINTLILLVLTPYLLSHLGDERYGIYNTVVSVIQYLVLLELGLRGAVARFCSRHITSGDTNALNSVASTTFYMCAAIGIVSMFLSAALGFAAPRFFSISPDFYSQTLFVFMAMGFNTVTSFLSYSFGGVLIGHNRFDLLNFQLVITQVLRAVLTIAFFESGWVSLTSWSVAIIASSLIGIIYIASTAYKLQSGFSISHKHINLGTFRQLINFGSWNMLIQLAGFIILSVNPVIIGKCLSMSMVAYYAVPFMLVTRLQAVVMSGTVSLMPVASSTLITGDVDLMRRLMIKGTYMSAALVLPLGGILLVMCRDLFRVWLPTGYESSWTIYAILMIAYFGAISQSATFNLLFGGGCIKRWSVVYFGSALCMVGLSLFLVQYMKLGLIGAALGLAIPYFFSNTVYLPIHFCHQINQPLWSYIKQSYVRPLVCAVPSILTAAALVYYLPPQNLAAWIAEFSGALLVYAVIGFSGGLEIPLREQFFSKLKTFRTKVLLGN